jgi:hypothetical protein
MSRLAERGKRISSFLLEASFSRVMWAHAPWEPEQLPSSTEVLKLLHKVQKLPVMSS